MEITTAQQTSAFLWSFLLGLILSVIYTLLVSVRDAAATKPRAVFLTDTLFSFFVCVINFLYSIALPQGRVRLYVVFAQAVSFFVFYFLVGRRIKNSLRKITEILSEFFFKLLNSAGKLKKTALKQKNRSE